MKNIVTMSFMDLYMWERQTPPSRWWESLGGERIKESGRSNTGLQCI